jgi:hypothetical protein
MDETNYMPMLGLAAGLLQGPQRGQPRGFGSSFSNGLLGGMQGMQMAQQGQEDKRRARLQDLQLQLQMVRAQKEQAQDAARQMAMSKLSPEEQQNAALMGDGYWSAKAESMFAAPKAPAIQDFYEGDNIVQKAFNPQTGQWDVLGGGRRFAPTQGPGVDLVAVLGEDGKPRYVPDTQAAGMTPYRTDGSPAPSSLSKLIAERNQLAPDDPNIPAYDAAIAKETTRGDGIKVLPDGTVQIGGDNDATTTQGKNEISKARAKREAALDAIKRYRELIDKTGGALIPGADTSALEAARTRVIMAAKDAFELGAITGPDLPLMETMVPGSTGMSSLYKTGERANAGLDELEKEIERRTTAYERGYGGDGSVTGQDAAPPPAAGQAGPQPPQISSDDEYDALPSGSTFMSPDGKLRRKP